MNRLIYFTFLFMMFSLQSKPQSQIPDVVEGKIERIEDFQSKYVSSRNLDIWLPEGYSESIKYPVLYMHNGQMLYNPKIT